MRPVADVEGVNSVVSAITDVQRGVEVVQVEGERKWDEKEVVVKEVLAGMEGT